ncbi:MAG: hypothetical protein NXI01_02050 [Gammaproteobacteria bacterium]|nr:hypothetical protein [Gammaproteobacteria bacterium]
MLAKIKTISIRAQQALMGQLPYCDDDTEEKKQLELLLTVYRQIDALILAAEQQHATVGLWFLSQHLNHGSADLNADELMVNFLNVLHFQHHTTFAEKLFTKLPHLILIMLISILFPSPIWILSVPALLIVAFPIIKASHFDMSNWYGQTAYLEKVLGITVGFVIASIVLSTLPGITLFQAGMTVMGMTIAGLSLLHGKHLQEKSGVLETATKGAREVLALRDTRYLFLFKPVATHAEDAANDMRTTLRGITAGA